MISTTVGRAGVAALILLGMAVVGAPSAQAACKGHSHLGRAEANFQFVARGRARSAWRNIVRDHDGAAYAVWNKAVNRDVRCDKSGPGTPWRCRATGRPCN